MTDWLLALVPTYGPWLLLACTFLACLALPVPASVLMLGAGSFVAAGDLSPWASGGRRWPGRCWATRWASWPGAGAGRPSSTGGRPLKGRTMDLVGMGLEGPG
jgi:membrane-associated protein